MQKNAISKYAGRKIREFLRGGEESTEESIALVVRTMKKMKTDTDMERYLDAYGTFAKYSRKVGTKYMASDATKLVESQLKNALYQLYGGNKENGDYKRWNSVIERWVKRQPVSPAFAY